MALWYVLWIISLISALGSNKPMGVILSLMMLIIPIIVIISKRSTNNSIIDFDTKTSKIKINPIAASMLVMFIFCLCIIIFNSTGKHMCRYPGCTYGYKLDRDEKYCPLHYFDGNEIRKESPNNNTSLIADSISTNTSDEKAELYTRKSQSYLNSQITTHSYPNVGMSESLIDSTKIGNHSEYETYTINDYSKPGPQKMMVAKFSWRLNNGDVPLIVECTNGKVTSVTKYYTQKYWDSNGEPIF